MNNMIRVETDERVNNGVGPGGQEVPDQNQRQVKLLCHKFLINHIESVK